MPAGRPSTFTTEIADSICSKLIEGQSLRFICNQKGMPGRQTVLDWLDDDKNADFRAKYARARESQGDLMDDLILSEAAAATPETVNVARVRIDAYKWRASKLAPKKYGDKAEVAHTGAVTVNLTPQDVKVL